MKTKTSHSNQFALLGQQFIDRIDTILCELEENKERKDYEVISEVMPDVCILPGYHLHLHRAVHEGHGDNSYFFTRHILTGTENRNLTKEIIIPIKERQKHLWQIYLLSHANTLLPSFWHGNYNIRTYIFDEEYMKFIKYLKNRDWKIIAPIEELLPQVITIDDNTCKVVCHFWNEWQGLVRETCTYTMSGALVIKVDTRQEVLFPYHCGIWF